MYHLFIKVVSGEKTLYVSNKRLTYLKLWMIFLRIRRMNYVVVENLWDTIWNRKNKDTDHFWSCVLLKDHQRVRFYDFMQSEGCPFKKGFQKVLPNSWIRNSAYFIVLINITWYFIVTREWRTRLATVSGVCGPHLSSAPGWPHWLSVAHTPGS